MEEKRPATWEQLFLQARSIIRQAQTQTECLTSLGVSAGTALARRSCSRSIIATATILTFSSSMTAAAAAFLNARTQGLELDVWPDDYRSDGTKALKLVFTGLGEIDFICAAELTETPERRSTIVRRNGAFGNACRDQIAKKVYYRGGSLQPRDMFDIACVV